MVVAVETAAVLEVVVVVVMVVVEIVNVLTITTTIIRCLISNNSKMLEKKL